MVNFTALVIMNKNADKPRDAFVQYVMAWMTPKHAPPYMRYCI